MPFSLHPQLAQDGIVIGKFEISLLLMINDIAYPWFVLVPRIDNIKDAHQLSVAQHMQVLRESRALSTALMRGFEGEKMNVAALGNMVPQLHIHHVVRSSSDAAWPAPIWGYQDLIPMDAKVISERVDTLTNFMPAGLVLNT